MIIDTSVNNKRIAKNTLLLYARMMFLMLISLYTSRIVLKTLGISDFGIYNIVGGLVVFFTFLNNAMVSSIQRFLNYEMGQAHIDKVKDVFSMSINCQLLIILLVVILSESIGLWFLNSYINIPKDRIVAANWVYQFSVLSICIGILYSPYNASIIAYERMSVYAYIGLIEATLKLLLVFLLTFWKYDKLVMYTFLLFVVNLIVCSIYIYYCHKKIHTCKYYFIKDKMLFKKLMSFSGWSLFGSGASIGTAQGINIIINIFFGVKLNAAMGVANQVNAAINNFLSNFVMAYQPQIVKAYASKNFSYFQNLIFNTTKLSYYLLFVFSFPLIISCNEILHLWLVNVPNYAVSLTRLILIFSLIESIGTPLWISVQAVGKIKIYQIVISCINLFNIPLGIIFFLLGTSPESIIIIRIITNIFCQIFRVQYLHRIFPFKIKDYIKLSVIPCFIVTCVSIPIPLFIKYVTSCYWGGGVLTIIASFFIALTCIWILGLSKQEKIHIINSINNKIKLYINKV